MSGRTTLFASAAQAAEALGFRSTSGIRTLVLRGELRPIARGPRNTLLFEWDDLEKWARHRGTLYERRLVRPARGKDNEHAHESEERTRQWQQLGAKEAPRNVERYPRKTRHRGILMVGDGLYRIRVRFMDPRTGRKVELDRVKERSEREALLLSAKWRAELEDGAQPKSERIRVGEFAKTWLRGKLNVLLPPTIDRYTQALEEHILPALGHFFLDALRHDDVVAFRDAKKAEGYKAARVNGFLRLTKTLLADAAAQRGQVSAAARVAALPEDDTRITHEEPNSLTAEEAERFLDATRVRWPEHYPLVFTLLVTGVDGQGSPSKNDSRPRARCRT